MRRRPTSVLVALSAAGLPTRPIAEGLEVTLWTAATAGDARLAATTPPLPRRCCHRRRRGRQRLQYRAVVGSVERGGCPDTGGVPMTDDQLPATNTHVTHTTHTNKQTNKQQTTTHRRTMDVRLYAPQEKRAGCGACSSITARCVRY